MLGSLNKDILSTRNHISEKVDRFISPDMLIPRRRVSYSNIKFGIINFCNKFYTESNKYANKFLLIIRGISLQVSVSLSQQFMDIEKGERSKVLIRRI